jgi:hypothetical protein
MRTITAGPLPSNRLFDADAQLLRRFAARLPRAGQLRRQAAT